MKNKKQDNLTVMQMIQDCDIAAENLALTTRSMFEETAIKNKLDALHVLADALDEQILGHHAYINPDTGKWDVVYLEGEREV